MRDSEIILYNIKKQTLKKGYKHDRLYRILYNTNFYPKETKNLNELIESLKNESYKPKGEKIIFECCKKILEAVFSSDNYFNIDGKENCQKTILTIKNNFNNMDWFVKGNIKTSKKQIIELIENKIQDMRFIRLIRKFLNSGYDDSLFKKIYFMDICLNNNNLKCVTYKDNYFIGIKGLLINFDEQAEIRKTEKGINFLGYGIKKVDNKIKLFIPKGTIEKFIVSKKMVKDIDSKKWTMLHRNELINKNPDEIINKYKDELINFYNYYKLADNVKIKTSQLKYVMHYSCLKTLAAKHKSTVNKIKLKYKVCL